MKSVLPSLNLANNEPVEDRTTLGMIVAAVVQRHLDPRFNRDAFLKAVNRKKKDRPATWRSRLIAERINVTAVLKGQITAGAVEDIVGARIQQDQNRLNSNQNNGEWRIVAFEAAPISTQRVARQPSDKPTKYEQDEWLAENPDKPKGSPDNHVPKLVVERGMSLRLVWVDMLDAPELDQWELRTGKKDGRMSGVSEGRIPALLQKHYDESRQVVRDFNMDAAQVDAHTLDAATVTKIRMMRESGMGLKMVADILDRDIVELEAYLTEHHSELLEVVRKPQPAQSSKTSEHIDPDKI